MATVDGIHALVNESNEFDSTLSSHKFGGQSALEYEVALSIWEPKIGHINDSIIKAGKGGEAMFKSKLEGMVPPGKLFIADKKYCAFPTKSLFEIGKTLPSLKSLNALARQEALNNRIKKFGCMDNCWRRDRAKHVVLFEFCVVACGEDLFFLMFFRLPRNDESDRIVE
jgi:hypothetical protein